MASFYLIWLLLHIGTTALLVFVKGDTHILALFAADQENYPQKNDVEVSILHEESVLASFPLTVALKGFAGVEFELTQGIPNPSFINLTMKSEGRNATITKGWIVNENMDRIWLFSCSPGAVISDFCTVNASRSLELILLKRPVRNSKRNLALHKPAYKSSNYVNSQFYQASLCTDGMRTTLSYVCYANSAPVNWISVDLGDRYSIGLVRLGNHYGYLYTNTDITVGISDQETPDGGELQEDKMTVCNVLEDYRLNVASSLVTSVIPCEFPITGRYLKVKVSDDQRNNIFPITEVEAYELGFDERPLVWSSVVESSGLPWELAVDSDPDTCMAIPERLPYELLCHLFLVKFTVPWEVSPGDVMMVVTQYTQPMSADVKTDLLLGVEVKDGIHVTSRGNKYKQCVVSDVKLAYIFFKCTCPEENIGFCDHIYFHANVGLQICGVHMFIV